MGKKIRALSFDPQIDKQLIILARYYSRNLSNMTEQLIKEAFLKLPAKTKKG